MAEPTSKARLTAVYFAARETNLYEFRRLDGEPWPDSSPGAHIDLHLPNGMLRQYSLVHAGGGNHAYVIGVRRDRTSRGGSKFIHEQMRVGDEVEIGGPRNHFSLEQAAPASVLVAGGIGITPIYCMVERLSALGLEWRLYYSCRTRAEAAFIDELRNLAGDAGQERLTFHFDEEEGGGFLDMEKTAASAPANAHLYCCGPAPMLQAFEAATAAWPKPQVHVEYFTAAEAPALEGGFIVELARSGLHLAVPEGRTILEALRENGVEVPTSCEQGVCGACETAVISGEPDHRDMILSTVERAANKTMMVCCSGSKSARLVLDL